MQKNNFKWPQTYLFEAKIIEENCNDLNMSLQSHMLARYSSACLLGSRDRKIESSKPACAVYPKPCLPGQARKVHVFQV